MGRMFKVIGFSHSEAQATSGFRNSHGRLLQAPALSALAGIRHAFFTRQGGVSTGLYESLNGGVGSDDAPANVAENRARMAEAVGVPPDHLLTCYQIHSPEVVTAMQPWARNARPRADAIVTRVPGLAIAVSTADCGPVLFADAARARRRRGACRLARRLHRCARGNARRHGAMWGRPRQHRGRARPDDPATKLRGRPGIRRAFPGGRRRHARFFKPAAAQPATRYSISRATSRRALVRAGISRIEDIDRCTYARTPRRSSAIAVRCIAAKPITDAI